MNVLSIKSSRNAFRKICKNKLLLFLFLLFLQLPDCSNVEIYENIDSESKYDSLFIHDSLIVRAILDSCNLSSLNVYDVISNRFGAIKSLDLNSYTHSCNLSTIPGILDSLQGLEELGLSGNNFTKFPDAVLNLQSLQSLDFSVNKIESIPDDISRLTQLTDFKICDNKISVLPVTICDLKHLYKLDCSYNDISSIPENICNLINLGSLIISGNKIMILPDSIGSLNLYELLANNNEITYIPPSISNLNNLRFCDFDNNNITSLPQSITKLNITYQELVGFPGGSYWATKKGFGIGYNNICIVNQSIYQWLEKNANEGYSWATTQRCTVAIIE